MQYPIHRFLIQLSLVIFLFAITGCDTEEEVKEEYDKYTFDPQVISKLPLYDSLATAIIENFPAFQKYINADDSYRSFRYMPFVTDDPDVYIKLPKAAAPNIDPHFNRLGKDFIYGFDIFKDSSIKFFVRTKYVSKSQIDINENLSYFATGNMRRRKFPEKDSVLNNHWQYWIQFSKRDLF